MKQSFLPGTKAKNRSQSVSGISFDKERTFISEKRRMMCKIASGCLANQLEILTAKLGYTPASTLKDVEFLSQKEFCLTLSTPCCILPFEALEHRGFLTMDWYLTERLGRLFFGQKGASLPWSALHQGAVQHVMEEIVLSLAKLWPRREKAHFYPLPMEVDPKNPALFEAGTTVFAASYSVKVGDVCGRVALAFDSRCFDGIRSNDEDVVQVRSQTAAKAEVAKIPVKMDVVLGACTLSAVDFLQLKAGMSLKLGTGPGETLDLLVEDKVKYRVRPGQVDERLAVSIEEIKNEL